MACLGLWVHKELIGFPFTAAKSRPSGHGVSVGRGTNARGALRHASNMVMSENSGAGVNWVFSGTAAGQPNVGVKPTDLGLPQRIKSFHHLAQYGKPSLSSTMHYGKPKSVRLQRQVRPQADQAGFGDSSANG